MFGSYVNAVAQKCTALRYFRNADDYCCVMSFSFPVIDLSLDVIVDLAHHPNIIGIKESGGDVSISSTEHKMLL